ncbi:helix-turn-helix domain-containing protein [Paenibacillus brasilensis]|uniref:helix-turn-helix domain-containing protein n=1 Tax=Paenibacillus brasilensis TaxID=128574 RepID=UPI00142ED265|nr:helix-turn-helix transcriptional regulator [Paenibacillus brasilensis]
MQLTPEIIRTCRINLGMSQGKLAKEASVSVPLLGAIERDERPLLPHVAQRIRAAIPYTDEQIVELVSTVRRLNQ